MGYGTITAPESCPQETSWPFFGYWRPGVNETTGVNLEAEAGSGCASYLEFWERIFIIIAWFAWLIGHIVFGILVYINPDRFFPSREQTMGYEKEDVRLVAEKVTNEYKWVQTANVVLTEQEVILAPKEASANKVVQKTLCPKPVISPEEQEINEREEQ